MLPLISSFKEFRKILAQDELAPMRVCFSRASNLWRGLSRTRDISPLWLPVIHGWSESGLCRGFPREKCNGKSRHAWAERGFHCYSLLADRAIGHLVFIVTLHREWTYSTGKPGKRNYTGHSPPRQIHNYRKSVLFCTNGDRIGSAAYAGRSEPIMHEMHVRSGARGVMPRTHRWPFRSAEGCSDNRTSPWPAHFHQCSICTPKLAPLRSEPKGPLADSAESGAIAVAARWAASFQAA